MNPFDRKPYTEAEIREMYRRNDEALKKAREQNEIDGKRYGVVVSHIEWPLPEERAIIEKIDQERLQELGRKMAEDRERRFLEALSRND